MPSKSLIHILLADDEERLLDSMNYLFEMKGYKVTKTKSGIEALKIILAYHNEGNPVDLLITDIQMAGMTGEELITAVRQFDPKLPVLVITGFGYKELVIRLLRLGCSDYIDKPFGPSQIEEHVENLLHRLEKKKYKVNVSCTVRGEC